MIQEAKQSMNVSTVALIAVIAAWALGVLTPSGATGKQVFINECQRHVLWQLGPIAPSRYERIHAAHPPSASYVDADGFTSKIGPLPAPTFLSALGTRVWVGAFDTTPAFMGLVPERLYVVCAKAPGHVTEAVLFAHPSQLRALFP